MASESTYSALLYGRVFVGDYTPARSTANIVAISLPEKRKIIKLVE